MIDGDDLFFRFGLAHDDLATGQFSKVKRMQGLAALEHYIVGDVDNVIDRLIGRNRAVLFASENRRLQTFDQPLGAGSNLDAANQASGVAITQFRTLNFDAAMIRHGRGGLGWLRVGNLQLRTVQRRNLSRDADVA